MLQVRTARHRIHRWLIFQLPPEDFNSVSLWKWEVCSTYASCALLCTASDAKGRWAAKPRRPPDTRAPSHTRLSPGASSVQRARDRGCGARGGCSGGTAGPTLAREKPRALPRPRPASVSRAGTALASVGFSVRTHCVAMAPARLSV